jgi:hypothetical protein
MRMDTGVAGAFVETALIFVMITRPSSLTSKGTANEGHLCSDRSIKEKMLLLRRIESKGRNRRKNFPQQRFATSLAGDGDPDGLWWQE